MDCLNYETLTRQDYGGYLLREAPERVLQFGEGGFLRAFAEHFIDKMNEKTGFNGKVVLVQPRGGHPEISDAFRKQEGLYTLILRGRENGEAVARKRIGTSFWTAQKIRTSALFCPTPPRRGLPLTLPANCLTRLRPVSPGS